VVSSTSSALILETSTPEVATHIGAVQSSTPVASLAQASAASVSISVVTVTTCMPTVIYSTIPLVAQPSTSLSSVVAKNTTTPTFASPAQFTSSGSSLSVRSSLIFGALASMVVFIMV
jgi:hypothetical protein